MLAVMMSFRTEDKQEKFEFLYNRYRKLLTRKAYDILRDESLAQDAVSEAYIRVLQNLHKLDDLESGETAAFLVMVVKNVSLTMWKKRRRAQVTELRETEGRDEAFDPERALLSHQSLSELLALVDRLGEELRAPFLLKYAYGLSHREISRALGISENNAAVRVHRAKGKLAEALRGRGEA